MKEEKSADHLQAASTKRDSAEPALRGACLDRNQYGRLLKWWIATGAQGHDLDALTLKNWRQRFIKALSDSHYLWRELIQRDVRRLDEWSKRKILDWLAEAEGDPVMFLNLANVSPYSVLFFVEYWKSIKDSLDDLRKRVRSRAQLKKDISILKKAERIVGAYQPLLTCYQSSLDYWKNMAGNQIGFKIIDIQGRLADSSSLKKVVSIIKVAEENGLLLMGEKKRGGPSKIEQSYLVQHLVILIRRQQTKDQPKRQPYWGAIASLILAAFPEGLDHTNDPDKYIRNVKNAFKRKVYERILIARTQEGVLIWGSPEHF